MTTRTIVSTAKAPAAIGPYSQAVRAGGLVFTSGQIALDPQSGEMVPGDVRAQTERVMQNLAAVLAEASTGLDRVVRCTVYVADMRDFAAVNEVYARFFPGDAPPARATIQAAALPKGALVEVDCIALA